MISSVLPCCNLRSRGWTSFLLLVCLAPASLCCAGQARVFDATNLRGPVDLADGWLVHAGDDPAYARPDFDDSSWTPFNAQTDNLHSLFPHGRPEIVWYRLHVKVSTNDTELALLETYLSSAFEVYAGGDKLLQEGRVLPFHPFTEYADILIPIPATQIAYGSVVIALRVHISDSIWSSFATPGYYSTNLEIGQASALREHMWLQIIGYYGVQWLDLLLDVCMACGAVLLYSTQRDRPEYLWLLIWVMADFLSIPRETYALLHNYPTSYDTLCRGLSALISTYAYARMYCAFVDHKVNWKLHLFIAVSAISSSLAFTFDVGEAPDAWLILPYVFLTAVVIPRIVIERIMRTKYADAILLIPVLMIGLFALANEIPGVLYTVPMFRHRALTLFSFTLGKQIGPFYIPYWNLVAGVAKFSLALIVLVRTNRMSRQQTLLQSEIANAREVQKVILPEGVESIPGFQIESVYLPAREVGGDFFQILPITDQGFLFVLGDVAGKGLPAAMMVSVLVGAIRTAVKFEHSPDALLAELNERMMGRTNGGFSTAIAALIGADGSVHIANAGHLPPYLNGKEIDLPPALPLGIVGTAQYEIIQLRLELGDRMTFYSDGVIEAQNRHRELFGFDRGREVSTQPASAIAEAAKAFGQEDDITVIAIKRLVETE